MLACARVWVCVQILSTPYGHDTAFKDVTEIGPLVRAHLESGLTADLESERYHTTGLSSP